MGAYTKMQELYTKGSVFYLPEGAWWNTLLIYAKQYDIALRIDTAQYAVENNNKSLAGTLPDSYCSRVGSEVNIFKMGERLRSIWLRLFSRMALPVLSTNSKSLKGAEGLFISQSPIME